MFACRCLLFVVRCLLCNLKVGVLSFELLVVRCLLCVVVVRWCCSLLLGDCYLLCVVVVDVVVDCTLFVDPSLFMRRVWYLLCVVCVCVAC